MKTRVLLKFSLT